MAKSPDERLESKFIRDLRRENSKLRKEIASMRKKNRRLEDVIGDDSQEDEENPPTVATAKNLTEPCKKCNSKKIDVVVAGIFEIHVCADCGNKTRIMK